MRASVTFFLRDYKAKGQTAVLCRLRFNNKSVNIPTRISIEPKNWSKAKKRPMVNKGPVYSELKHQLDVKENRIREILFDYIKTNGQWPEPKVIKQEVIDELYGDPNKVKGNPTDFVAYWEHFVEQLQHKRTGIDHTKVTKATIQSYNNVLSKLISFSEFKRVPLSFQGIDKKFFYDLQQYLEEEEGLALNTVGKINSKLKTVMKDAHSLGVHDNTFFLNADFKVSKERTSNIYLLPEDLEAIERVDLTDKELDNVSNLFLILCYSGQRYSDLEQVLKQDKIEEEDGESFLRIRQSKTQKNIAIPLDEKLKSFLAKNPEYRSNPHINRKLKEVGELIPSFHRLVSNKKTKGGEVRLSQKPFFTELKTHTGRRTYATVNYIHNRKAISRVMAVTGHSKESTFLDYIQANDIDRVRS